MNPTLVSEFGCVLRVEPSRWRAWAEPQCAGFPIYSSKRPDVMEIRCPY